MTIRYTVDNDTFEVLIYDSSTNDEVPFLSQLDFPDGTPFSSESEASDWAKAFIDNFLKVEAE